MHFTHVGNARWIKVHNNLPQLHWLGKTQVTSPNEGSKAKANYTHWTWTSGICYTFLNIGQEFSKVTLLQPFQTTSLEGKVFVFLCFIIQKMLVCLLKKTHTQNFIPKTNYGSHAAGLIGFQAYKCPIKPVFSSNSSIILQNQWGCSNVNAYI